MMKTEWTVIKSAEWNEVENTRHGPYEFHVIKEFKSDGDHVIETTYKNGIIFYSACYPLDSDYARNRMEALSEKS